MKILHIISSLQRGGAETLLVNVIDQPEKEDTYSVIFFHDGPYRDVLKKKGIPVYTVQGFFCRYDPLFCYRLFRCIKKINPDVIHTWLWAANTLGIFFGRLLKIPVICSFHNNVTQDGFIRNFFTKITTKYAQKGVAVSSGVLKSVQALSLAKNVSLEVVYNGVEIIHHKNKTIHLFPKKEEFVFGSVGRWVSLKNYPLLIEAFACLYNESSGVRLILLGNGPEKERLQNMAKKHHLEQVIFFVENKPALEYYDFFDCFVLPSPLEGISMALLEAMSFKKACIVTSLDGTHEVIIHYDNGLIAEPTIDSFYRAMKKVYEDSQERTYLAKNAYSTIQQKFSLEKTVAAYKKIYAATQNKMI